VPIPRKLPWSWVNLALKTDSRSIVENMSRV